MRTRTIINVHSVHARAVMWLDPCIWLACTVRCRALYTFGQTPSLRVRERGLGTRLNLQWLIINIHPSSDCKASKPLIWTLLATWLYEGQHTVTLNVLCTPSTFLLTSAGIKFWGLRVDCMGTWYSNLPMHTRTPQNPRDNRSSSDTSLDTGQDDLWVTTSTS